MNIKITHRNGKVSDSVKDKVDSWLKCSQERYAIITSAHIILEKNDREDMAEATIHVAGKDIFALKLRPIIYMLHWMLYPIKLTAS